MGRRGNPPDNAKVGGFMKSMKVAAVYPMAHETFEDLVENLQHFIEEVYNKTTSADCIRRSAISTRNSSRISAPGRRSNQRHDRCPAQP
jgi:hypothetical protein